MSASASGDVCAAWCWDFQTWCVTGGCWSKLPVEDYSKDKKISQLEIWSRKNVETNRIGYLQGPVRHFKTEKLDIWEVLEKRIQWKKAAKPIFFLKDGFSQRLVQSRCFLFLQGFAHGGEEPCSHDFHVVGVDSSILRSWIPNLISTKPCPESRDSARWILGNFYFSHSAMWGYAVNGQRPPFPDIRCSCMYKTSQNHRKNKAICCSYLFVNVC